eukprot:g52962.t1
MTAQADTPQQPQIPEETAQPQPEIKKRGRGRPAGSGKRGLTYKPPFEMEVKNGISYYYQYLPRKNKEGQTVYYKHTLTYHKRPEKKRQNIQDSPESTQKKQKRINDIKQAFDDNTENITLQEFETLTRIFKELDITTIKETLIRLYGPNLQQPTADEAGAV